MIPAPCTLTIPSRSHYDVVVVGSGIVGLATAREVLRRHPDLRLAILEKEPGVAGHQTGHNSGVLHTGIYYKPGSLKAQACVAGREAMIAYCEEKGIAYELCGKLIVALDEGELGRLDDLFARGAANGVPGLEMVGPERIREIEPYAAGIRAIWSPNTGIVDYLQVSYALAGDIQSPGGEIVTGCRVTALERAGNETRITLYGKEPITARSVITCAGLHSDRIAGRAGSGVARVRIVPFRGDYYALKPEHRHRVRGLIYPVPDPGFPFLGVHYTRTMSGEVWAGPNAVLAFAREGYRRFDINLRDLWEVLSFSGFWALAGRYWRMGITEFYRDYVKAAYLREMRRYMPSLNGKDVVPGPSGVRAQALDMDGTLLDDFLISYGPNIAHVQNAPSPAATSSLVIAGMIVDEVEGRFSL